MTINDYQQHQHQQPLPQQQIQSQSQSQNSQQQQLDIDYPRQIIWRRNAPYFYQVLYTTELQWPSLTVEWRPDPELNANRRSPKDSDFVAQLVYATNTSSQQPNYLVFGKVRIPNQQFLHKQYKQKPPSKQDCIKKNDNAIQSKIQIKYEVQHPGQINRVRYNPVMTQYIASRTSKGDILIIDQQKYMKGRSQLKPYLTLKGHDGQGFALQWNKNNHMQIAAGSYDGKLSVWNTVHKTTQNCIAPMSDFIFHKRQIQDVSWNNFHDSIFASCDDGGYTAFWDMRNSNKPIHSMQNHQGTIFSIEFSPLHEYLWATGGEDRIAKVWDVRNVAEPLFEWKTGEDAISNLRWSADDKTSLWTVNEQIMTLWDVCNQQPKYVHGGHLKRVNEMAVHPNLTDLFASVDEDNAIHVFQPNKNYK